MITNRALGWVLISPSLITLFTITVNFFVPIFPIDYNGNTLIWVGLSNIAGAILLKDENTKSGPYRF